MTAKSIDTTKKSNLTFSAVKMKYLRTPEDIWSDLTKEFNFTVDCCASDQNHLLPKYYTIENSCLDKDWSGEVAYIHPLFDMKIKPLTIKSTKKKNNGLSAKINVEIYGDHLLTVGVIGKNYKYSIP